MNNTYQSNLDNWIAQEKAAVQLMGIVGQLWFDRSVELMMFHLPLYDQSVSEVLSHHDYATNVKGKPLTVADTLRVGEELVGMNLAPAKIDLGKLTFEWKESGKGLKEFLRAELADFIGADKMKLEPRDVVLYGFGRIGRLAARELIATAGKGEQLRLKAIVTRGNSDEEIKKRAALLRVDSVHGPFPGTIVEDLANKALVINGITVRMIHANTPAEVDYTAHGINDALIIDNTGAWRDRNGLGEHLKAKGAAMVLLTAPGKGDIPNIVHGVNHRNFDPKGERIFSAASCTTNAIVPVLKVIEDAYGIEHGHIETIHAYTNDQNLLDNYHKKYRRGRSAVLNMVITETGAGSAVAKVIPHLKGKLTSNAVRVPTPDGSLAILNLTLKKKTSVDEINATVKHAALNGELVEQIQYSVSNELVSSDIVGNFCASIFDSPATIVSESGQNVVLYCWYDNEYGYTRQVLRLSKYLAEVRRLQYY
jgi:glyceraldehyde 3-phosphate dehydrogenase